MCLNCLWILLSNLQIFRICDTFDEMSQKVSVSPDTVAELVELQNYVVECRDVTMYNLREQIRKTAEYVMFLMNHAHLSSKSP